MAKSVFPVWMLRWLLVWHAWRSAVWGIRFPLAKGLHLWHKECAENLRIDLAEIKNANP